MNMFQMIVIYKLELKNGLLNLDFGTNYNHCATNDMDSSPLLPMKEIQDVKKSETFPL